MAGALEVNGLAQIGQRLLISASAGNVDIDVAGACLSPTEVFKGGFQIRFLLILQRPLQQHRFKPSLNGAIPQDGVLQQEQFLEVSEQDECSL